MPQVYQPAEDSFLISSQVKKYLMNLDDKTKIKLKVLDMGSGSGIQALACIEEGVEKQNILCADINEDAINSLKKQKFNAIHSNLFEKIKKDAKFDLIVFNPPYLPEGEYDKEADTTAGKRGYETIVKFLEQAKTHLNPGTIVFLLFSSLSKPRVILTRAKKLGYSFRELSQENLFFEKLFVYRLEAG